MANLAATKPDEFIALVKKAGVKDFAQYRGFDYTTSKLIILESGR